MKLTPCNDTYISNSNTMCPVQVPEGKKIIVVTDDRLKGTFRVIYEVEKDFASIGGRWIPALGTKGMGFSCVMPLTDFLTHKFYEGVGHLTEEGGYAVLFTGDNKFNRFGKSDHRRVFHTTSTWLSDRKHRLIHTIPSLLRIVKVQVRDEGEREWCDAKLIGAGGRSRLVRNS